MRANIVNRPVNEVLTSYLVDFSYQNAGKRLGMASSAIKAIVSDNPKALHELQSFREVRVKVDADYVLSALRDTYEAKISEIHDDSGLLLPVSEWPAVWQRGVSGLEIHEKYNENGESIGRVAKVRMPDKLKTLELMGKHTAVSAFTERVEVEEVTTIARRLIEGRNRENNKEISNVH